MSRNKVSIEIKRSEPSQPHLDHQNDTDIVFNYRFLYVQDAQVSLLFFFLKKDYFQVFLVAW